MPVSATRVFAVAAALASIVALTSTDCGSAADAATSAAATRSLEPKQFSELATGVVLIRTFDCGGSMQTTGSGFLLGTQVVMTARHVAFQPTTEACRIKVRAQGRWISVVSRHRSAPRGGDGKIDDIATLKLAKPVRGTHIFSIATSPARIGTILAMLGHPLGNDASVTQGRLLSRTSFHHAPYLAINLLGAEGASGSAIVNTRGNVVSVLQRGSGSEDALGEYTGGLVFGIDLPTVWTPAVRRALCRAYPAGGIPSCAATPVALSVTEASLRPGAGATSTACAVASTAAAPCLTVPTSETEVTIGLAFDAGAVGAHTFSGSIAGPGGTGAAPGSLALRPGQKSISWTFSLPRPARPGDYTWSWTVSNGASAARSRSGSVAFRVLPA